MNESESSLSETSLEAARREAMQNLPQEKLLSMASSLASGKDWKIAVQLLAPQIATLLPEESEQIFGSIKTLVGGLIERQKDEYHPPEFEGITYYDCSNVLTCLAPRIYEWDDKVQKTFLDSVDKFNTITLSENYKDQITSDFLPVFSKLNPQTQQKIFQIGTASPHYARDFLSDAYPGKAWVTRAECSDGREYDLLTNGEPSFAQEVSFCKDPHDPQSAYIPFDYNAEDDFRKRSVREQGRLHIGRNAAELGSLVAERLRPPDFFAEHAKLVISEICRYDEREFSQCLLILSAYLAEMRPPQWEPIVTKISEICNSSPADDDASTSDRAHARSDLMKAVAPCLLHMNDEPALQQMIVDAADFLQDREFVESAQHLAPYLGDLHPDIRSSSQNKLDEKICGLAPSHFVVAASKFRENITNRPHLMKKLTNPAQFAVSLKARDYGPDFDCLTATHYALQKNPDRLNKLVRAAIAPPFKIKAEQCVTDREKREFDSYSEGKYAVLSFELDPHDTSNAFVCDAQGNPLSNKNGSPKVVEISNYSDGLGGLLSGQLHGPLPYQMVNNHKFDLNLIDQSSFELLTFLAPHWNEIDDLLKTKIARFACSITDGKEFSKAAEMLAKLDPLDSQIQNEIDNRAKQDPGADVSTEVHEPSNNEGELVGQTQSPSSSRHAAHLLGALTNGRVAVKKTIKGLLKRGSRADGG